MKRSCRMVDWQSALLSVEVKSTKLDGGVQATRRWQSWLERR